MLELQGLDNTRTRVVVTLLHANEPSGLKALHRLLCDPQPLATRTVFILASVTAACTTPVFSHRMLPGQRDLNRCFNGPFDDMQGQLAFAVKTTVASYQPEAVIDLHNTSGSGPAFSVALQSDEKHLGLASHFCHKLIHTDIRLGSLMEQAFDCPVITIEAGGAQDPEADERAYLGLLSFLQAENPFARKRKVHLLYHPRRLELCDRASIGYASAWNASHDLTLNQNLETLNFGVTEAGQRLGWMQTPLEDVLKLDDDMQEVSDYFACTDGQLITKKPLQLFMVTTNARIAKSDCLFYFVE